MESRVIMEPSLVFITVLTALFFPISEYEMEPFEGYSSKFIRLDTSLSDSGAGHKRRQRCIVDVLQASVRDQGDGGRRDVN